MPGRLRRIVCARYPLTVNSPVENFVSVGQNATAMGKKRPTAGGRPRRPPEENMTARVYFKVLPESKIAFEAASKKANYRVFADWVRDVLNEEVLAPRVRRGSRHENEKGSGR